jgi:malonyl-CoA decarboxylase
MSDDESTRREEQAAQSFLDWTFERVRHAWRDVAGSARDALSGTPRPELSDEDAARLRGQIQACLDAVGGAVSARARAAGLGRTYLMLNAAGRQRFLMLRATEFALEGATVDAAAARLGAAGDPAARRAAEDELRRALMAPRVTLLTQFNALPEGVKFLVDMRAELLRLRGADPALDALESDLKRLLASWFDIGFLELRRITWKASAMLLEKLIAYEAVHAIKGWEDLKNRLDSDRGFYAFFHPSMPEEPLIFVEVALVDGLADNVHHLLDQEAPVGKASDANTAIFYSISNAQRGLAGISFGGFLIKRVVDHLATEFKGLKTFATLSPIPGFVRWLAARAAAEGEGDEADGNGAGLLIKADLKALAGLPRPVEGMAGLAALLAGDDWCQDAVTARALKAPVMRLGAHYLMRERRAGERALDPVAHFHLSNGARIERLNWLADTSPKGLAESAGMMVNYQYRLGEIEDNHEAYTADHKMSASTQIRTLSRG